MRTIQEKRLTREDLRRYFVEGIKKPNDLQIGVEWEKIGVYKESLKAIRYSGERGVEKIFKAMIRRSTWKPVKHGAHIIALQKGNSSITLEPGGQIELSGKKSVFLDKNVSELHAHLKEIKRISDPLGIAWLGIGAQPVSRFDEIQWVPKKRYGIMRRSLKGKGSLTYAMMKETASIQISLDYLSEKDAVEKLRLAFALSPILSAIFANSPISRGRLNGFLSRRCHIWRHTAPERTGILTQVFKPGFNFDRYSEYALSVPMLFIVRGDHWIPARGMTFKDFLACGIRGYKANEEDWKLHLTTIFTEARLKQYIEIRGMDCQKTTLGLSAPALVKGVFYDALSRKRAWELVADLSIKERLKLSVEVPIQGIHARFKNGTLWDAAVRLLGFSEQGLDRLAGRKLALRNEARYLDPLKDLLIRRKKCPAEVLIECFSRSRTQTQIRSRIQNCAAI